MISRKHDDIQTVFGLRINERLFRVYLLTECAYSECEPQGDDRSLERHCGQGNRPMSFRGVKRRGNPLNRNKNRLTIATNRISPRAYYRTENLCYQFEQGQELLPQLRQIICLVKVGRDTRTRYTIVKTEKALRNLKLRSAFDAVVKILL